jgi:hypothetical protein
MGNRAISTPEWDAKNALWHLSAIAPKREKRIVEIWQHMSGQLRVPNPNERMDPLWWTKKGQCEIED